MPAQVYLIRHGETEWSRTGQHTSTTDLPLTPNGEEEARRVAARLRGVAFARVLVSPRQRARRTCEIVGLAGAAEVEPNVREWEYGDFEGLRSAEILQRRPDWNLFRDGGPNGETPAQVAARADAVIARLRVLEGKIAVVSHGHFLRAFAARWAELPIDAGQRLLLSTASLSILGYEHDRVEKPVIILWNQPSA
jgi:broad specificity phosphatase PhoE